jgi:hypothetical protein
MIFTGGGRGFSEEEAVELEARCEGPGARLSGGMSCSSCCGDGCGDSTASIFVGDFWGFTNCAHLKDGCLCSGLGSSCKRGHVGALVLIGLRRTERGSELRM